MKRLLIRLSLAGVVLVSGVIAIAQTFRSSDRQPPPVDGFAAKPPESPQPIPAGEEPAAPDNPYNRFTMPPPQPTVMRGNNEPSRYGDGNTVSEPRPIGDANTNDDPYGLRRATSAVINEHEAAPPTAISDQTGGFSSANRFSRGQGSTAAIGDEPSPVSPGQGVSNPMRAADRFSGGGSDPRSVLSQRAPRDDEGSSNSRFYGNAAGADDPAAEPRGEYRSEPAAISGGYRNRTGTDGGAMPVSRMSNSRGADNLRVRPSGTPGPRQLEGAQTPQIVIEKRAPEEIQVGKTATFEIKVRNTGKIPAQNVTVIDQVPQGTILVEAAPEVTRTQGDGHLVWELGMLAPGQELAINLQLRPDTEGEIGSVAQVTFQAQASVRTVCTKPQLLLDVAAPQKVMIGEPVRLSLTLSNPGSGSAANVVIEEDVPEGLSHPAGKELEYEIGTLRAGESKRLELTLTAAKPGIINNLVTVRGEGDLKAQKAVRFEVLAPQIQVGLEGPKLRFLDRQATYVLSVKNPGTAPARDVELVAYLPKGLRFMSTENKGHYDAQNHAVFWSLEELPAGTTGAVQLTLRPVEVGQQKVRLEGKAGAGLNHNVEMAVQVDGLAELHFTVKDQADPIEVGAETSYEVRVTNSGSKQDTNIRLVAEMPNGMRPLGGDGPTVATVREQRVIFDPVTRLAPRDEIVYRIRCQATQKGVQLVRVQLVSDEMDTPVTKEEGTRVYSDE